MLLVSQAVCDLSLPDYTSKIVNVGIQQGGIENPAPEQIRQSEMEKLLLLVPEESRDAVLEKYTLNTEKDPAVYEQKRLSGKEQEDLNGILEKPLTASQATRPITRAEFAVLLANALPSSALEAINQVRKIPDVSLNDSYGPAVYRLYRAGVFAGKNETGVFLPQASLSRAEAAVLIARMMEPERRLRFTLN